MPMHAYMIFEYLNICGLVNSQTPVHACIYDICGLVSGSQRRSAVPRPQICQQSAQKSHILTTAGQ